VKWHEKVKREQFFPSLMHQQPLSLFSFTLP